MSEQLNLPEGHEQPSIASGVMHGPYPQTEAHPWDQINGHDAAVTEAYYSGSVSRENADKLRDNLGSLATDAHHEQLEIDYEKEQAAKEADDEARGPDEEELRRQEDNKYLSGEDLAEYEHGKKHGMYNN